MALSDKEVKEKTKSLEQIKYKVVHETTVQRDGKDVKIGLHEDNHDFKKGEEIWLTPRRAKQINTGVNGEELKIVEPAK